MLQIKKVKAQNYRGIQEVELLLPQVGVLVGDYHAGKTNFMEAISHCLGSKRWVSDLHKDSFYRGVEFDGITDSDHIHISLVIGSPVYEELVEMIGEKYEQAIGRFSEQEAIFSFDSAEGEYAIEVHFEALLQEDGQVVVKRFLQHSLDNYPRDHFAVQDRDFAREIGFFYFPLSGANNRKWFKIHFHDLKRHISDWLDDSKGFLQTFDHVHKDMLSLMEEVDQAKTQNLSEEAKQKLFVKVASFVSDQAEKVKSLKVNPEHHPSSTKAVLNSFKPIVAQGGLKELLHIISGSSHGRDGINILGAMIQEACERLQAGKPCIFCFDESEAYFHSVFFWERFLELVKDSSAHQAIFASHYQEILDLFTDEETIYLHNVFGSISVLNEAIFDGLYS